jgi:CubicO group peptidase (beta-lactamase class C family)
MAYNGQPGLSVGIVHDQEVIWTRGFGYADVEQQTPAAPDTLYRIASITKLFTNTAILHLRDAGKLQLDDPITRYLPWFNIQNHHSDAPPITIRHLITHTSGLPREAAFPYWTDAEFPTLEQIQEKLPIQEAILPTETRWKYSNLALSMAGEIVAIVSGQPYADYVQEHILDPLGMKHTLVRSPEPGNPQLATGYGRRLPDGSRSSSPYTDSQGCTPAFNMSSTVEDLARFAMLHFRDGPAGGVQILRGSTLREMQRIHWLEPKWQAGWGLGFRIMRQGDKTYVGHGGAVLGYRTLLQLCPADKIAVVVLTNADDGDPLLYVEKAFQWVAPSISKAVAPPAKATESDPAWQAYVGKYRNAWGDSQVLVLDGKLAMIGPALPDPTLAVNTLVPVGDHTFRAETEDGYSIHGELVVFEMDDEGQVHRVKAGQNFAYPVGKW